MKDCHFVVIGEAKGRRVQLFEEALAMRSAAKPVVVSYADLLSGAVRLSSVVKSGSIVRIESPGKDFEAERAFLMLGADCVEPFMSKQEVGELEFDRGLILPQKQWYYGWCQALRMIGEQLRECPPHFLMNGPDDIALLFDKFRCHELMQAAGVRTPALLGRVSSFAELLELMRQHSCRRVFVKPRHSSSASGIVAYQCSGRQQLAISTVEMVRKDGGVRLYNSRKVRRYTSLEEIGLLIDRLSVHNLIVEKWYPKAGIGGKRFDLRVVVIGGVAKHVVVRESKTPFTNLHLLNARGQVAVVREALGEEQFEQVLAACQRAAREFPGCLYVGVDLLIGSDFKSHVIGELNAFGDLLPGVLFEGQCTYETELDCVALKQGQGVYA